MDRYETCLLPLLKKLIYLFPKNEIIIIANGHVKLKEQKKYLARMETLCKPFSNVKLFLHSRPKGLSTIWNQIIKASSNNKILILNDDVNLKHSFCSFLANAVKQDVGFAEINSSWSHFIISKSVFSKVGDFDESFIEIGGEDDDYSARLALHKIKVFNFRTTTIAGKLKPKLKKLTVNSYGKNMHKEQGGYSTCNTEYLSKKWIFKNDYFKGAIEVPNRSIKYWKLKK